MINKIFKYSFILLLGTISVIFSCTKKEIPEEEEEPELTRCDSVAGFISYCDSLEKEGIFNDFKFPEIIGTEEWAQLTREQRDSAVQIPEDELVQMCTHDLIETCFNYPFLLSFSERFDGKWNHLYNDFNGIRELVTRCDAPEKMLKKYVDFEYPYVDSISPELKFKIKNGIIFTELFLAQEDIVTNITNKELIILGQKAKELFQIKCEYSEIEFNISSAYSCYILGRMMYYGKYEPCLEEMETNLQLKNFILIGSYIWNYDESWEFIINNIDNYLNKIQTDEI